MEELTEFVSKTFKDSTTESIPQSSRCLSFMAHHLATPFKRDDEEDSKESRRELIEIYNDILWIYIVIY